MVSRKLLLVGVGVAGGGAYALSRFGGVEFGRIIPTDMKPATVVTFNNALLGIVSFISSMYIGLRLAKEEIMPAMSVVEKTIPALLGILITTGMIARGG